MVSFPYYSHTTPIRIPQDMGIAWETYHKGVPLLEIPENPTDFKFIFLSGSDILMDVGNSLNPAIDIGPERDMEMGMGNMAGNRCFMS